MNIRYPIYEGVYRILTMLHGDIVKSHGKGVRSFCDHQVLILQLTEGHEYREGVSHPVHLHVEHKTVHAVVRTP